MRRAQEETLCATAVRPSVGRGKAATIRGLTTIKWRNKERRSIVSTGQCAILRDHNELRPALKSLLLSALRATSGILNLSESSANANYQRKHPRLTHVPRVVHASKKSPGVPSSLYLRETSVVVKFSPPDNTFGKLPKRKPLRYISPAFRFANL